MVMLKRAANWRNLMSETINVLFLSANPWNTGRIQVDEEAREIFEKLQEGPFRERFILHKHSAIRPSDIQRLLMRYRPQIVHFSGHGSKKQKIILGGRRGRGKQIDPDGLVQVFALYKDHVRLVVLNACLTAPQARSLSEVIDYSVGAELVINDKEAVAFAGAFYRGLGYGESVKTAFESAKAEVALINKSRAKGLGLFIRKGVDEDDRFPMVAKDSSINAVDAGRPVSDLFSSHLGDAYILQRAVDLFKSHKIGRTEPEIPVVESSAIGPSSNLVYEEEYQNSEQTWAEVSSIQTETGAALGLMRAGDERSLSASLRKVNRAKRAGPHAVKDAIDARSSISYTRAHATVTIKVQRVVRSVSTSVGKISSRPKGQGRHPPARSNKRGGRGKRLD
jgi:hypothetical protein